MTNIAFIGLGHMGLPMAVNLTKAGHTVAAFDLSEQARDAATQAGVPLAESGAAAASTADVVITMLPKGAHVLAAYEDLLPGATAATLTFMVGADDAVFVAAEPILDAMGKRVVHCGGPGVGQAAKICNNMILGVSMIAISEAFVLGEKLGLSHQALFDVAANASGQCWALTSNCPVPGPVPTSPANRDYAPGFAVALMAKDLGLAANAVRANGVDAQLGLAAAHIYDDFNSTGGSGLDFSAIFSRIQGAS